MICYHNLGEIAHDVVTACPVRIGIKKRARCCDYWDLGLSVIHRENGTLIFQNSITSSLVSAFLLNALEQREEIAIG
jgi:hypothetical protein